LYDFERTPGKFILRGRQLKIDRWKKSRQQSKTNNADQSPDKDTPSAVRFTIGNIHYGTLIMGSAMKNIITNNSADHFGLIAHQLINNQRNVSTYLRIDPEEKKISILVSYRVPDALVLLVNRTYEWDFST